MTEPVIAPNREHEQRDARLIAQSFLKAYPRCFHLLGGDVVMLMVEGFILRRILKSLLEGHTHGPQEASTLHRLACDVFNAANQISAETP